MSELWAPNILQGDPGIVMPGDTMPAMFWNAVAARGDSVWLRQKELGVWRSWSWNQTATLVEEIACGLLALGLEHGQCASILANTTVEWVWADLAVLSCGGVANGIYPTDAAAQVHYLCEDSRTRVLFVEDDEQLDKALEVRGQLPELQHIVVFDMEGLRDLRDDQVISLERLRELGRDYKAKHPETLQQRVQACKPEDLAILVYTSGTTGKPKGAMHLHQGLVYTVRGYNTLIQQTPSIKVGCPADPALGDGADVTLKLPAVGAESAAVPIVTPPAIDTPAGSAAGGSAVAPGSAASGSAADPAPTAPTPSK